MKRGKNRVLLFWQDLIFRPSRVTVQQRRWWSYLQLFLAMAKMHWQLGLSLAALTLLPNEIARQLTDRGSMVTQIVSVMIMFHERNKKGFHVY